MQILLIAVAGCLGVLCRYWLAVEVGPTIIKTSFPFVTLIINVSGSFLIGLCASGFSGIVANPLLYTALTTGFLGGFTTFSAFSLETLKLFEVNGVGLAFLYSATSVVLGVGAAFLGMVLGR